MKRVLLTGFEPFGGETINPALEVIKELAKEEMANIELIIMQLPVIFRKAYELLTKKISEVNPDLIISIGQAGGSVGISVEKVGLNFNDSKIPDNEGLKPKDELIISDGPAAYFTTINVRKTTNNLKKAGIPTIISYSAGTYVCNNLIYGALHFLDTTNKKTKYGFIHVPFLPQQVVTKKKVEPSMSLMTIKEAIKIIITSNLDEE
ncbi:MAG: pyroglutamyl-peptidase I [Asgard group archaeon]|nr:pyroglutamyl-peptidase I [Asgard group archaeon]